MQLIANLVGPLFNKCDISSKGLHLRLNLVLKCIKPFLHLNLLHLIVVQLLHQRLQQLFKSVVLVIELSSILEMAARCVCLALVALLWLIQGLI